MTLTTTKAMRQAVQKAAILDLIKTNDKAACRAVVAIYKRQTASEQSIGATLQDNNQGFTATDARGMTAKAKLILRGIPMAPFDLVEIRKRMPKYTRQLIEIGEEREAIRNARDRAATDAAAQARVTAYGEYA